MANEKSPASSQRIDYQRLFQLLRWATITFVFVAIQLPTSHVYIKAGVYTALAIAGIFDLVWNFVLPKSFTKERVFTELALDVVWITLLQLPTGQIHSPFYFIYALPILGSALVLDRREVNLIGAISAIILVPVLFLHLWGEPLDLNHVFSYLVRFGLVFFCAFIGGLLAFKRGRLKKV